MTDIHLVRDELLPPSDPPPRRHLISIADLERDDVERLLATARTFEQSLEREMKKPPTLRGRLVVNMFFESSTRTSSSFELAAKRLSADVMSLKASGSSVDKGESLKDTIQTISAYGPNVVVIRHAGIGALTVGQRQGLGAATGERLYVLRLEPDRRAAIVGTRSEIAATSHALRDVRFTADIAPAPVFEAEVRLRYGGTAYSCAVTMTGDGARVDLREPALVAPGQAAVLYRGDEVLGGGIVRAVP